MGDFSLTTFSSKGKLLQIEYALEAVKNGETAIGIKVKQGVVIAVEKKSASILIDGDSYHKIQNIATHVGAVYSGLGPDFRVLLQKARKQNQAYHLKYQEPMWVSSLCRETAQIVQEFTQSGGVRPFGVSLLVAGYDDEGPRLFQIDPSGAYYEWKATAIGKNMDSARTYLEKNYKADMVLEEAIQSALKALKEGFQGQMSAANIEVGIIGEDRKFRVLRESEVKDYIEDFDKS